MATGAAKSTSPTAQELRNDAGTTVYKKWGEWPGAGPAVVLVHGFSTYQVALDLSPTTHHP
eukprot:gene12167-10489_t